jgi:protein-L-isoaspartate(D-aspartate) O-methyltransferase
LVAAAFESVARHLFLPDISLDEAYRDIAIPTKFSQGIAISSSSQPAIMAEMLEQLELQPGHRVLEIGAGTGYNAALMSHIVGEDGHVVTVDIDDDLVRQARSNLDTAGFRQVEVICGDGGMGYEPYAPYDRIMLTVGAWDVPPALTDQLVSRGRLVLPLSIRGPQKSIAFEKQDGCLVGLSARDCGFMRLRGSFAGPERTLTLEPARIFITIEDEIVVDVPALRRSVTSPGNHQPTGITARVQDLWNSLMLWTAISETGFCMVWAEGDMAESGVVPDLFGTRGVEGRASSFGLVAPDTLCLLGFTRLPPSELQVVRYGPNASLCERLARCVESWDRSGRPSSSHLHMRLYPHGTDLPISEQGIIMRKPWMTHVVNWH